MFDKPMSEIIWCYTIAQNWMTALIPRVKFHQGLIPLDQVRNGALLVIDDLMESLGKADTKIATQISHHREISVIYITQNLFYKGAAHRDLSLNANYITLFKNPRDKQQASILARQIYPRKTDFFMKAFEDATSPPHGYLVISLRQSTPEVLRLTSQIFPLEKLAVYIPSSG
jgi:hypothetical protein